MRMKNINDIEVTDDINFVGHTSSKRNKSPYIITIKPSIDAMIIAIIIPHNNCHKWP